MKKSWGTLMITIMTMIVMEVPWRPQGWKIWVRGFGGFRELLSQFSRPYKLIQRRKTNCHHHYRRIITVNFSYYSKLASKYKMSQQNTYSSQTMWSAFNSFCRGKTWVTSEWTLIRVDLYRTDQGQTIYTPNEQLSSLF